VFDATKRQLLFEAYTKAQLARNTGVPADLDMLLACGGKKKAFPKCESIFSEEIKREVVEGKFLTRLASDGRLDRLFLSNVLQFSQGWAVSCGYVLLGTP